MAYHVMYVKASVTDIENALRQANAWNFVNDFPRKLETYAGERGVKLSGGQKQRLAIARAIIRKPTMIFLDEATSALDSKAEKVVQEALDKMIDEHANGCTLIIAHRLSTLRTCDRIIVMERGSIKESGSHDELMNIEIKKDACGKTSTGWYRDLYETQHGKDGSEKINAELANLRRELQELKQENSHLRGEMIKSFKLGRAKRATQLFDDPPPQMTALVRHLSDGSGGSKEGSAPLPLDLNRAKTTFDW